MAAQLTSIWLKPLPTVSEKEARGSVMIYGSNFLPSPKIDDLRRDSRTNGPRGRGNDLLFYEHE